MLPRFVVIDKHGRIATFDARVPSNDEFSGVFDGRFEGMIRRIGALERNSMQFGKGPPIYLDISVVALNVFRRILTGVSFIHSPLIINRLYFK